MATVAHKPGKPHRPPVERPDRLTSDDLAAFQRLGIPSELLVESQVHRVSDRQARELGFIGPVTADLSGIVFPYPGLVTGRRVTARLRRDSPDMEAGKEKNKYISAYGDHKHLFFPPGATDKLQDAKTPIALVEAEKSSLALTAMGRRTGVNLLAVAMGGCWGWKGRIGKVENSRGERVDEKGPISDLDCVNGRKVFVLLDANVASKPEVRQARTALVRELVSRKSEVFVCNLPAVDGVNGPDDYIGVYGDEAMAKVFTDAENSGAAVAHYDYGGGRFEVSDRGVVYIGPPDKDGNAKSLVDMRTSPGGR